MSVNSTPHASVHDTANQAGSFSFSQVKPALSFEQQVELMRSRGLAVDDVDEAIRWLSETNYYRIRGYWLKAFPTIIVLKHIYERVWPEKWPQMTATLDTLIRKYPGVDLVPLGFPEDWRQIIMEQT